MTRKNKSSSKDTEPADIPQQKLLGLLLMLYNTRQ